MLFINGLTSSVRTTAGYCMMHDFSPSRVYGTLGSTWQVTEGSMIVIVTIYLQTVSKHWKPPVLFGLSESIVTAVLIYT